MKCDKHGLEKTCLAGESAHHANWHCPLCNADAENAKLREQLRTAYPLSDTLQHWKERAEAAEAKLNALDLNNE